MHEATFIRDLAIVIVTAASAAVFFRVLRLPALMGYLLAGMLIGPHLFEQSLIADQYTIEQMSELGVIFLMFYIGMEFELNLLKRVLAPSLMAVVLQTVLMLLIGLMSAPILGWGRIEGLFLGALLAISSSMVTIQVFRDRGVMNHPHAQLAMGILILEDILAIALLVILTGVGVTGEVAWGEIWHITFLIGVFVVAVYVVMRLAIRPILDLLHKFGSPEMITLVAMALVLGVGEMAAQFHFSVALGAFLAGAILSKSSLAEDIEHLTAPLRMLFSAVFFVAVGMMINPSVLIDQWEAILALSALVIACKVFACFGGLSATGNAPRSAMRAALGKAQIGEFSFVIAALGESLGVTDSKLTAVAGGVALFTILATYPLSSRSMDIYCFARKHAPEVLVQLGRLYQRLLTTVQAAIGRNELIHLIKQPLLALLGYVFLFNAVVLLAAITSATLSDHEDAIIYQAVIWSIAALASVPMVVAVVRNLDRALVLVLETVMSSSGLRGRLQERVRPVFYTLAWSIMIIAFGAIFMAAAADVFPSGMALGVFVTMVIAVSGFFWSRFNKLNTRMEGLFIESFQQEAQSLNARKREGTRRNIEQRYPWEIKLAEVSVDEGTEACGKQIRDLNLRQETGAMIIAIARKQYTHFDPSPETPLFPGDRLVLLGTSEQTTQARIVLSKSATIAATSNEILGGFEIDNAYLEQGSTLEGDTLAGADLRKRFGISVIGIQRGEKRITSPHAKEMLLAGDLLWIAGNRNHIQAFQEACTLKSIPA